MNSKKHRVFRIFSHRGIDFRLWLWYIHTITKAVTKTSVSGKIPREEFTLVQEFRTPAGNDTTSELPGGNSRTGAPVKASMSDSASCNQGGTVEYFVSHP